MRSNPPKCRTQAALLFVAAAKDGPDELRNAFQIARKRGTKWETAVAHSLRKMPETRTPFGKHSAYCREVDDDMGLMEVTRGLPGARNAVTHGLLMF